MKNQAWLNNLYEEGTKREIFDQLLLALTRIQDLENDITELEADRFARAGHENLVAIIGMY